MNDLSEPKLRQLAVELAKDIEEPHEILKALGITELDYEYIKDTRAFKIIYNQALAEWGGATNTQKRTKLKAAYAVEKVMSTFYADMLDRTYALPARTELLKTMARIGGLGNPEPVLPSQSGQYFKLEIHLAGRPDPIVVSSTSLSGTSPSGALTIDSEPSEDEFTKSEPLEESTLSESKLAEGESYDEL